MEIRLVDEWDGGFGWLPAEPELIQRCSHAVRSGGGVWLTDPLDGEGLDERVRALGEPAGVVQLLDRHNRDCAAVAARLGVPLHRVPFGGVPAAPFETVKIVDLPRWHEVALWFPRERVLVCADALGALPYFLAPGERLGVHPLLRALPPRRLDAFEPLRILAGHGEGLHGDGAAPALHEALRTARRRLPAAYLRALRAIVAR